MIQPFSVTLLVAVFIGLVSSDTTVVPDPSDTCDKCCQGHPGNNGINGHNGLPGRDGLQGSPGGKGERGEAGISGPVGLAGLPGPRGPVGERGEIGPRGFPGKVGPVGIRGLPGTSGRDGVPGSEGSKGQKGDVGVASARSAFMVLKTQAQTSSVEHETVDFTRIQTNIGSDFDINTDRFTCRISGTYVFIYHALTNTADGINYVEIQVMLNGNSVMMAKTGTPKTSVDGSAILNLEQGDQVWLAFDEAGETANCGSDNQCSLSGFLLYEN